jgi:uncharacterized membrane protein YgcG
MNQNHIPQEPIDPRLEELLDSFRSVPPRDPEAAEKGRLKFLTEVDAILQEQQPVTWRQRLAAWIMGGRSSQKTYRGSMFGQKAAFTSIVTIVAVLVLLFGGASVTAYAAQDALPGDALYPVKTNLEEAQVNLSRNAANKAKLHLAFAERRLDEIARLIGEGRFNDIGTATREFEFHTQAAIDELITVAAGDPTGARDLATQISSSLTRYAQTLSGMVASVPDAIKPEMERAIDISQTGSSVTQGEVEFTGTIDSMDGSVWVIDGRTISITSQTELKGVFEPGFVVKVHAMIIADGSLVAREIDPGSLVDGGNENSQQNGKANDNTTTNQNEQHGDEVRFTGVVETIGIDLWVIDGKSIAITTQTEIRDVIQIGDLVDVRAIPAADGSMQALRLELADVGNANIDGSDNTNQNGNGNNNQQQGDEVRFTGSVESKSGDIWRIGGRNVRVTPQTDVRGNPSVGSTVEVRAIRGADGALIALRIEQKDSSGDGNSNSNGNDNTNTNDNGSGGSGNGGSGSSGSGGSGSSGGGNDNGNDNQDDNSNKDDD